MVLLVRIDYRDTVMAYKGDTWFRQRGNPTFRRFFVYNIFEDAHDYLRRWEHTIGYNLDNPASWKVSLSHYQTELGEQHIAYKTDRKYTGGMIFFTIEMYRDGFHIKMNDSDVGIKKRTPLRVYLFDDINRDNLWTNDAEKVAPMANELLDKIEKYFSDKR